MERKEGTLIWVESSFRKVRKTLRKIRENVELGRKGVKESQNNV